MFTVALIGPDGSGKSTVSKYLIENLSTPVERIYMGINRSESNYVLPTTHVILFVRKLLKKENDQGGPRMPSQKKVSGSKNPLKTMLKEFKSGLVLIDRIMEEWYRQLVTWQFVKRGRIVIFDRHFYADYYEYTLNESKRDNHWASRIHGYMLQHLYPKPDLVIYLDAPAEVLFARKGEGTVGILEERRQSYLGLKDHVPRFEIVDASQPIEVVCSNVEKLVYNFTEK